jgi:hypothetical protein
MQRYEKTKEKAKAKQKGEQNKKILAHEERRASSGKPENTSYIIR